MNTNRTAPPTVPPKPGETPQPTHVDVDPAPGHEEILEGDETEGEGDEEEIEGLDEDDEVEEDFGSEDDEEETD